MRASLVKVVCVAGVMMSIGGASQASAQTSCSVNALYCIPAASATVSADVLIGTSANDVLNGLAGNDSVFGGLGSDNIKGGPGNDVLRGGAGRDKVSGGTGNDGIWARDNTVDTIECGSGSDVVHADAIDKVAADCESVLRG